MLTELKLLTNKLFVIIVRIILGFCLCFAVISIFTNLNNDSECEGVSKLQGYMFYTRFPFVDKLSFPPSNAILCSNVFLEGVYEASMFDMNRANKIDRICDYINSKTPFKSWNQCGFNLGIAIVYDKRSRIKSPEALEKFIDSKIHF